MMKTSSSSAPSSNGLNSLVNGTKVEGNISSDSDIRVDGAIKGTLNCKAKVIIGPTGMVEGEIYAENAMIEGRFEGILQINEVLHITEQARVTGEISASKLVVQPGAVINGSFDMSGNTAKAKSNGALKSGESAKKVASAVSK
ncbi:MAG: polymer-forming cytoskeletal protein [Bacteroidota bacterium]